MTKVELLERIAKTDNFLEFHNDEFMAALNTLAETDSRVTIAYCLHLAYINGRRDAATSLAVKAESIIQFSDSMQALAMDLNQGIYK